MRACFNGRNSALGGHKPANWSSSVANYLNGEAWFVWNCFFRITWAASIPERVAAAEWKALKPNIGRVVFLMKR